MWNSKATDLAAEWRLSAEAGLVLNIISQEALTGCESLLL
jgi:hypothetical protein